MAQTDSKATTTATAPEQPPVWLAQLLAAMPQAQTLTPEMLDRILAANSSATATAMKTSLRPENENPPPNSVFHPLGMEKGTLRRDTFVCYVKQREDNLTPGEVAALNAIDRDCDARNGRWTAKIERNGNGERLFIMFPCKSIDDRMDLPNPGPTSTKTGLELIVAELLGAVA